MSKTSNSQLVIRFPLHFSSGFSVAKRKLNLNWKKKRKKISLTSARECNIRRTSDRTLSRTSWNALWCHCGCPGSLLNAWGAFASDTNARKLSSATTTAYILDDDNQEFDFASMAETKLNTSVDQLGEGDFQARNPIERLSETKLVWNFHGWSELPRQSSIGKC